MKQAYADRWKWSVCMLMISLMTQTLSAQQAERKSKEIEKNAIYGNILGTAAYLGLSYERFFSQKLSAEVGIGLIGIGAGISYYPIKVAPRKIRPYVGLKGTSHAIVDGEHKMLVYLPLGFTFFSRSIVNIGMDIGPAVQRHVSPGYMPTPAELEKYPFTDMGLFGNLKLGIRF